MSCCRSLALCLFCFVSFSYVLLSRPFVQSFFVLRYACAPTATRYFNCLGPFSFSCFSFIWRCRRFSFVWYVSSFRVVLFCLVTTTGWTSYISSCENSIDQSINQSNMYVIHTCIFATNESIPTFGQGHVGKVEIARSVSVTSSTLNS